MTQWLYWLSKQAQTATPSGFGNSLKSWVSPWKMSILAIIILSIGLIIWYYQRVNVPTALEIQVNQTFKEVQKAETHIEKSSKDIQKLENERIHRNHNIDVLIDDSVQVEIDREFNFPNYRHPTL